MVGCDLCGSEGKLRRVSLAGFGIINMCETCNARLAAAYPGQRTEIARQIAAARKRILTK